MIGAYLFGLVAWLLVGCWLNVSLELFLLGLVAIPLAAFLLPS